MFDKNYYFKIIPSPVGDLKAVCDDKSLCALMFNAGRGSKFSDSWEMEESDNHPLLIKTEKQLFEYFTGKRKKFELPLADKGTVFQMKAWRELKKIPYGKTISYGAQAEGLGDKNKARAVGMANNQNPICIVIPCHRVVGADGSLVGFGGGLKTKEYLLNLERKFAG